MAALGQPGVGVVPRPPIPAARAPPAAREIVAEARQRGPPRVAPRPPPRPVPPPRPHEPQPRSGSRNRPTAAAVARAPVQRAMETRAERRGRAVQPEARLPMATAAVAAVGAIRRIPQSIPARTATGRKEGGRGAGATVGARVAAVVMRGGRGRVAEAGLEKPAPPALAGLLTLPERARHQGRLPRAGMAGAGIVGAVARFTVAAPFAPTSVRARRPKTAKGERAEGAKGNQKRRSFGFSPPIRLFCSGRS